MKTSAVFISALVLISSISCAGEYKKVKGVIILNDKNFAQAVEEFPKLFVKFYAPWCPHCKTLAPKWEQLAKENSEVEEGVVFAKMDSEKNPNTSNDFNVGI